MIMVSDMTMSNYTNAAAPAWSTADNFMALINQDGERKNSLLEKLSDMLHSARR